MSVEAFGIELYARFYVFLNNFFFLLCMLVFYWQMMFTAVTDDGVSLGSERGSELMLDGADPACPLCNV